MYNYRVLLLQQIYSNLNAKPFKLQSLGYFPTSNPHKFQLIYVKRYLLASMSCQSHVNFLGFEIHIYPRQFKTNQV